MAAATWREYSSSAARVLLCNFTRPMHQIASQRGHVAMAAWLARVRTVGWVFYLSQPRYALVVLRRLAARGFARRARAFHGKERVLDFLFPGDQAPHPGDGAVAALIAKNNGSDWAQEAVMREMLRAAYDAGAASQPQANKQTANKQAKRHRPPRLPDELFAIIVSYYWGGGMSAEEEAAAAAEAAARAAVAAAAAEEAPAAASEE